MDIIKVEKDLNQLLKHTQMLISEDLSKYTYTKTGGPADLYVTPSTIEDTAKIIQYGYENNINVTILGNGSNIIIRDGGIRGIVLNILELNTIEVSNRTITAGSGAAIIKVSETARDYSLSGLEFACGIPGSVGGAVYMNAGAYGGEVKDCLIEATVITSQGEIITLTNDELELGYRTSKIQTNSYTVVSAKFSLRDGDIHDIQTMMDDLTERRTTRQPLDLPSCGSVFQRPPGNFAGKLIQEAGLQGHQIGGVMVSKKHAGFMVNVDNGTGSDYEKLIQHVQDEVKKQFGVELNTEVRVIGEPIYKRSDKYSK